MVYTLNKEIFERIEKDELYYFTDLINVFSQRENPYKVAIDNNGSVLDDYSSIENHNRPFVLAWLEFMSYKPTPFEKIDIDLTEIKCIETKYLTLCKTTKSVNRMIVYSKQDIKVYECHNDVINFQDKAITVLDKDTAVKELKDGQTKDITQIISSQVAMGASQINDSNN